MPRGDRTGPGGFGPMTGRGSGYCAGYSMPGFVNPWIPGGGRGRNRGWGRGVGQGWGSRLRGRGFGFRSQGRRFNWGYAPYGSMAIHPIDALQS
jgi:hypothetical protein